MLLFLDQRSNVRVVRVEDTADGKSVRSYVGTIPKSNLEVPTAIRSSVSASEATEIGQVVDFYKQAEAAQRQYYVAKFPELMREVMEHFEIDATDTEKRLIESTITEAARRIRRGGRQPAGA